MLVFSVPSVATVPDSSGEQPRPFPRWRRAKWLRSPCHPLPRRQKLAREGSANGWCNATLTTVNNVAAS